jgi:hypothetical protein
MPASAPAALLPLVCVRPVLPRSGVCDGNHTVNRVVDRVVFLHVVIVIVWHRDLQQRKKSPCLQGHIPSGNYVNFLQIVNKTKVDLL